MMVRRRKVISNIQKNKIITNDPKFQYKCLVHLVNYDFSKYSNGPLGVTNSLNNVSDTKDTSSRLSKTTNRSKHSNTNDVNKSINTLPSKSKFRQKLIGFHEPCKQNTVNTIIGKTVEFTDKLPENDCEISGTVDKKLLRTRKNVNYKERNSIGTPEVSRVAASGNQKLPIYRKIDVDLPKSRKRKGDLYDFFPDSDDDKDSDASFRLPTPKNRNKRLKFLKNITCQGLGDPEKLQRKPKIVKYDDKINLILHKFSNKIKHKKDDQSKRLESNSRMKNKENGLISNYNDNEETVFNSTMLPDTRKTVFPDESIIVDECYENNLSNSKIIGFENISKSKKMSIPASENSSFNTGQDSNSNLSSLNMSPRSFGGEIDNLFGFDDEVEDNRGKGCENGINIIQNIVINRSTSSEQYMPTPRRFREQKSWRFVSNVVNRNPHFIALKKNSLPSLNQEVVLDHTFDERINEVNKMVLDISTKKSPRQQSILNFIKTTKEYPENHNFSQSLYDIDEFSPVKNKNEEKENSPEEKKLNYGKRSKRNILGVLNDMNTNNANNDDIEGKKTNSSNSSDKSSKELDTFGFNSSAEVTEKDQVCAGKAKPFRVEFTYTKCKKNNILSEKIDKPVRDSEVKRLIEDDPGFDNVVNQDGLECEEVGLFEDIQESPRPVKSFKPQTKKKTNNENKNKPTEAKLSKEAKKWIKQFNQMCDEVDEVQLEVE